MTTLDGDRGEVRMGESYGGRAGGASVRDAQRLLERLGGATSVTDGTLLEVQSAPASPPRLEGAQVIEGHHLARRAVAGDPVAAFAGFLDGIQRSVIASYLHAAIPVVHGTVAAAVRARHDRQMHTWGDGPLVERALFVPAARAGAPLLAELAAAGIAAHDTLPAGDAAEGRHPQELLGLARQAVQQRREQLEEQLSAAWCAREHSPLYVDGGISGFVEASRSPHAIGVVKSHRTLYVAPEAVSVIAALVPGERSSAFVVATRRRTRVVSWYLKLRADGDPFAGLVRVEVAEAGFDAARADLVSRWVLSEREPVALPDPRWRVMAYGIRDCEQYLRAVAG
jgi:hypothetical protein